MTPQTTLKTEKQDIDGLEVEVTQHPPMAALPLFNRLGRAIGPAFFAFLEIRDLKSDAALLAPALTEVFERLSGDEMQSLTRELLRGTSVVMDGKKWGLTDDTKINGVFAGRLPSLLKVLRFAAEVNFGNFFETWRPQSQEQPQKENPST